MIFILLGHLGPLIFPALNTSGEWDREEEGGGGEAEPVATGGGGGESADALLQNPGIISQARGHPGIAIQSFPGASHAWS
jgi:hypothetical protein